MAARFCCTSRTRAPTTSRASHPGTTSVDIDVYDSAAKVDGISGEALVLRAETEPSGKTLNVAENFFVQNTSAPPRTQYGANTFDFYLPKGAADLADPGQFSRRPAHQHQR